MPVFRTPQSLGPRSLDVLQFKAPIGHQPYRNSVEPIGSRPELAPCDPRAGGHGNRVTLFPGDSLQGMAERGPAATLYLDKRNESILLHHEVDLFAEKAKVAVKDSPTPLNQEDFGQRLETAATTYGVQGESKCFGLGGLVRSLSSLEPGGGAMAGGDPPGYPGGGPLYFFNPAAAPHALSRPQSPGSDP